MISKPIEADVANNGETTKKLGGVTGKGFMPGRSGNPDGRPKKRLVDEVLEELLETDDSGLAKELAMALLERAKAGDVRAIQLAIERTQGKPKQAIGISGVVEPVSAINVTFHQGIADRLAKARQRGKDDETLQNLVENSVDLATLPTEVLERILRRLNAEREGRNNMSQDAASHP